MGQLLNKVFKGDFHKHYDENQSILQDNTTTSSSAICSEFLSYVHARELGAA